MPCMVVALSGPKKYTHSGAQRKRTTPNDNTTPFPIDVAKQPRCTARQVLHSPIPVAWGVGEERSTNSLQSLLQGPCHSCTISCGTASTNRHLEAFRTVSLPAQHTDSFHSGFNFQ